MPRRDAEITILPNGDVQVVETWEVKFSGGPFTSAFRAIPLNKVDGIDGWSVADEEHPYRQVDKGNSKEPYTFEYTIGDGQMKATWYYPSTTDQTRTFKVGYTLHGALRIDAAGDEFYWKFIESDRQYPIAASRVALHLPAGFKAGQLKAMMYRNGTEQADTRVIDDRTIEYKGESFPGGTEWEIRAQFPHGVVKVDPSAWQKASLQPTKAPQTSSNASVLPYLVTALVILLGGWGGAVALIAAIAAAIGVGYWLRRSSSSSSNSLKGLQFMALILGPLAAYGIAAWVFGAFNFLIALFVFLFCPVLVSAISGRRSSSSGGSGDWGGGDWGGGGGGDGGGGGGSSGFS